MVNRISPGQSWFTRRKASVPIFVQPLPPSKYFYHKRIPNIFLRGFLFQVSGLLVWLQTFNPVNNGLEKKNLSGKSENYTILHISECEASFCLEHNKQLYSDINQSEALDFSMAAWHRCTGEERGCTGGERVYRRGDEVVQERRGGWMFLFWYLKIKSSCVPHKFPILSWQTWHHSQLSQPPRGQWLVRKEEQISLN